jgi:hypothetical protein
MKNIVEFSKVAEFIASASIKGYRIAVFEPDEQDPVTHYYVLEKAEEITVGYFGHIDGASDNHGFIARTPEAYFLQLN